MDCREVEFVSRKSEERVNRALKVFPKKLLMRLMAFVLYLLGASRKTVASQVGMPEESVKTVVRTVLRDGFPALRDRRRSDAPSAVHASSSEHPVIARREGDWLIVELGTKENLLKIPVRSEVLSRTLLLSFVNSNLLSAQEAASALEISVAHCRHLARKLEHHDVVEAQVDKRQGQRKDYRFDQEQKAELIQQLAARTVTGRSTTSDVLAIAINERTQSSVSARTIRWHVRKLGLTHINETLPQLVESLKKNS